MGSGEQKGSVSWFRWWDLILREPPKGFKQGRAVISAGLEKSLTALGRLDGMGQFGAGTWMAWGGLGGEAAAGWAVVGTDRAARRQGGGPALGRALPPWLLPPQASNHHRPPSHLPASPEAFWLHNLWRTLCKWALCKSSLFPCLLDSWTLINLPTPHVAVPSTPAQPPAHSPNQEIHLQRQAWSNRSLIWMCGLSPTPLTSARSRHFSQLTLLLPIQLQNKRHIFPLLLYFCLLREPEAALFLPLSCLSQKMYSGKEQGSVVFEIRPSRIYSARHWSWTYSSTYVFDLEKTSGASHPASWIQTQWNLGAVSTNDISRVTQQGWTQI